MTSYRPIRDLDVVRCSESHSNGRPVATFVVRYAGSPERDAPVCGTHANSRRRWARADVQPITDQDRTAILARYREAAAKQKLVDEANAAEAEKREEKRSKLEWSTYINERYTSTLVLEDGWREGSVREVLVRIHQVGVPHDRGFATTVELEMPTRPGLPFYVKVRNAEGLAPDAIRELVDVLRYVDGLAAEATFDAAVDVAVADRKGDA